MSSSKIIVLTGVTYGIGNLLAKWFLNKGHKVIGCGRSKDIIKELSETFSSYECSFSVVDVSESTSVKAWATKVTDEFGAPDLLINNAAIANKPNNLWEIPLEEFDKIIDVNLKGMNYVMHFFLPAMIEAKKGIIINVSSGWGRYTVPHAAPYCCTKWGVEGLSSALAQELPSPLACAAMAPGSINTEMLANFKGEEEAKMHQSPEEWAEKAGPYLLSLDRSCNGKQLRSP